MTSPTAALMESSIVCDLLVPDVPTPLMLGAGRMFDEHIQRYERSGVTFASFTIGIDYVMSIETQVRAIAAARRWFLARPERFVFVQKADDIVRAKRERKLAVNFNFQGTNPLLGDLNLVEVYYRLGVGHMLMSYNEKNLVGDGCHERTDSGLSRFGLRLVEEMNRVGMIVDVSHTGHRTTMDVFEAAKAPVIFSHSNPRALNNHERNIRDDQIVACAKTGGVIGVSGVGLFLSQPGNDISADMLARHIVYIADLVGAKHVGLGLDHIEDLAHLQGVIKANAGTFPEKGGYVRPELLFASPEIIPEIAEQLLRRNYSEADVKGVLGENFLRVFQAVWK
jgi:membrane dipeptidase